MDCNHYLEKIELMDGLNKVAKQKLLDHLAHCAACQEYYQFSLKVEPILKKGIKSVAKPILLRDKIISQLSNQHQKRKKLRIYEEFLAYPHVG